LAVLLHGIVLHPNRRISELPILSAEERRRLLVDLNNTARAYPNEKTLVDLFEEQVARTPEAEALVSGTERLTYRQLQTRALEVAQRLKAMGVGNETLGGICLGRSWEMVVWMLGIMKAGAAYVPMDPAYPKE